MKKDFTYEKLILILFLAGRAQTKKPPITKHNLVLKVKKLLNPDEFSRIISDRTGRVDNNPASLLNIAERS